MQRNLPLILLAVVAAAPLSGHAEENDFNIWINEFHYDNTGGDVGEFVEVIDPTAFTALGDLTLSLYNGADNELYGSNDTFTLADFTPGAMTAEGFTIYSLSLPANGLQNGSPDGLSLTHTTAGVLQALSYEGVVGPALDGPATGATFTDIGVDEPGSTAIGLSLQLGGSGNSYTDFTGWQSPLGETPGALNANQTLTAVDLAETPGGAPPAPPPPPGTGDVIAFDNFESDQGLISFSQNPAPGAFSSAGDGFEQYQRGVNATFPFQLLDDSASIFPGDQLGIVNETKTDAWFGVTDTVNGDNPSGQGTATWVFDIAGYEDLSASIEAAAMGDFEAASDSFDFTYSIDGGPMMDLFISSVDESGSQTYTLEGGFMDTLDDPLALNGTLLDNEFQEIAASILGTGDELTIQFTATTDGGSEGFAFDSLQIFGTAAAVPEPASVVMWSLLGMAMAGFGIYRFKRR